MAGKKALVVVAPNNFRDEELFHTKEELESAGINARIASNILGEAVGMLGGKAKAEIALANARASDFDAIVFVGGTGASIYFQNSTAIALAREFFEQGKVVAAICIAPSILANAGILKEKKATCYPSESINLKQKGANYTGKPVEVDGKIITASGPQAARDFGKAIAKAMK